MRAAAAPMPWLAPVTSATLPSNPGSIMGDPASTGQRVTSVKPPGATGAATVPEALVTVATSVPRWS